MIRRPPRSTLLSLHDALPISREQHVGDQQQRGRDRQREHHEAGEGVAVAAPEQRLLVRLPEQHPVLGGRRDEQDRKSTRLNSSHANISYAVFCLKKKTTITSI